MYEKLEECPSCKHSKFSNHIICKDFTVSGESFALMECNECSLIITNPRPDSANIGKYYDDSNYISHTNQANSPINAVYKAVRSITLTQKRNLIKKYATGTNLLDFGCGAGVFIDYMQNQRYSVEGYEPHSTTAQAAKELTRTNIHTDLKQLKKKRYQVITAWHVLEHVHDLKDTLVTLRKSLTNDGVLFVAVPNHKSYDAQFYKENWAAYDVPKHLYHFNQASLKRLAKKCKLQVLDIHPMKFDSYYVSLLSEKNKNAKTNYFAALRTGFISNQKAKETGEYSSLIYVLKA
jgi:2-polyprenyl-3-methyl-5-hydroxy-6-metoxy-1,4-benzoquinol methylase